MIIRDRSLRQQFAWLCEKKQKQEAIGLANTQEKAGLGIELNLSSRFPGRKPDVTEPLSIAQVLMSPYLSHISILNTFLLIHAFFFLLEVHES